MCWYKYLDFLYCQIQPYPDIRFSMIWNLYQQRQIWDAQQKTQQASNKVENQANTVSQLKRENERLTLACQSMWELLRDHLGFTDEHLEAKILEVDARDGQVDGKIGPQTVDCPSCGHKTNTMRETCLMCGAPVQSKHVFE